MSDEDSDSGSVDIEVLRSACVESRAVLDDQLHELSDIGDKALWTVRTSMIVLGLMVSATSLGDVGTIRSLHWTVKFSGVAGVLSLLASSLYGLGMYVVIRRTSGIGPAYRQKARGGHFDEQAWRRVLLHGYDDWIADMEAITDMYGTRLFLVQMAFFGGVFLFTLAGGLSIWTL